MHAPLKRPVLDDVVSKHIPLTLLHKFQSVREATTASAWALPVPAASFGTPSS